MFVPRYVSAEESAKEAANKVTEVQEDIRTKKETMKSNEKEAKELDKQVAEINKKIDEVSSSYLFIMSLKLIALREIKVFDSNQYIDFSNLFLN